MTRTPEEQAAYDEVHQGDEDPVDRDHPRVTVTGDAEKGWAVEVHDGENSATYSHDATSAPAAIDAALQQHKTTFQLAEDWFKRLMAAAEAAVGMHPSAAPTAGPDAASIDPNAPPDPVSQAAPEPPPAA